MAHFNFIACDNFDIKNLTDVETFVDNYPGFQTVALADESELQLLLQLMGIDEFIAYNLNNSAFIKYWDTSNFKFPELDEIKFDDFYQKWKEISQRENSMNEYGSLIFLQGLSSEWNKLNHRIIIQETS